jgi:hypothetical protein
VKRPLRGPAALGQHVRADPARIGTVESLHPLERKLSLACERTTAGARIEKVLKAAVASRRLPETTHDAIELLPEIIHRSEPASVGLPALSIDIEACQGCLAEDIVQLRGAAVDELGAQFDRYWRVRITMCEHTATETPARLEHHDVHIRVVQGARGRETRGTRADHDHIHLAARYHSNLE